MCELAEMTVMDERSIFLAALEKDSPDEQTRYLDEACAQDTQLRRQVESLLRASRDAGSFLEKPPAGLAATIAGSENDTVDETLGAASLSFLEPSEKPGCLGTLAQYEVVDVVGRGGMGIVLRAYDTKLNRVVAIKAMASELAANPMAVKRFLREARAAAAVSHDHVVTIYAIEEDYKPPFIVMEFVDGQSLQEKIDRTGGFELKEILRISMQMARGLAAAHEQGLVHRDIKPANILLENGVERVKLTDFGLARAVDDVSVTQTGQIAGTPQFMSPEQAQGHAIDARSDLFSLGSVMYTMCTGRPPFRAETPLAMLRRVSDDEPRPIREISSETPDWLEAIIFKLLAKDPAERFQSADEVAQLLSAHLAHLQHPATAPRPKPLVPPRKQSKLRSGPVSMFDTSRRSREFARGSRFAALALLAIGLLFTLAAIIYVVMDKGTLIIESEDENVEIMVTRPRSDTHKGLQVRVVDRITGSEVVRLPSGHYQLLLMQGPGSNSNVDLQTVQLSKDQFVLKRGDRVIVRLTKRGSADQRSDRGVVPLHDTVAGLIEVGRFTAHEGYVYHAIVSPDGQSGISCGSDKQIRVWDIETQQEKLLLKGHDSEVLGLAVSADGKLLASCDKAKTIRLWDLRTGEHLGELIGHEGPVTDLAFIHDGVHLLSAGFDETLRLWNVPERRLVRTIGLGAKVEKMEPLWDGRRVMLSGAHTGGWGMLAYDLEKGERIDPQPSAQSCLAVSSDRRKTLIGSITGVLKVTDMESGELIVQLADPRAKAARDAAISPDARFAITTTREGSMHLWDLEEGTKLDTVTGETIGGVSLSPDGRFALTIAESGEVGVWRLPERVWRTLGASPAVNSLGMQLRLIPAGEFLMGTADEDIDSIRPDKDWFFTPFVSGRRSAETPRHSVTISQPFYMSAHEVTVEQFRRFVDDTQYKTTAEREGTGFGWQNGAWRAGPDFTWRNPGFKQDDSHPVCNVSVEDAEAFCRCLNTKEELASRGGSATYRLPTEAEWEYACRAGTTTLFATGDDPASLQGAANLADAALRRQESSVNWAVDWEDGFATTAPVGSFAPNAFGLYDMHGNVWEWCQDVYDENWYETSPAVDPVRRGSTDTHVFRGGGFDNWPGFLRSADRYSSHSPTLRTDWAGFRVVRELSSAEVTHLSGVHAIEQVRVAKRVFSGEQAQGITSLAITPDGKHLITGSYHGGLIFK